MTRDKIIDDIEFEQYDENHSGIWSNKELENAMVAAYNRAIEDSIKNVKIDELESDETGDFTILNQQVDSVPDLDNDRYYIISKESLEKLKIV